jgi:ADP-ribose pyrophosphatase YjhB (NUDIX family)
MSDRYKTIIGVLVLILQDDKVLMIRRKNKFDAGLYSLPGGCLEENDGTIAKRAIIEAKEEVNVDIKEEGINIYSSVHRKIKETHYESVEYFAYSNKWSGEIMNCEPHKCDDVRFFPLSSLPENISKYALTAIEHYKNNKTFEEINF